MVNKDLRELGIFKEDVLDIRQHPADGLSALCSSENNNNNNNNNAKIYIAQP